MKYIKFLKLMLFEKNVGIKVVEVFFYYWEMNAFENPLVGLNRKTKTLNYESKSVSNGKGWDSKNVGLAC